MCSTTIRRIAVMFLVGGMAFAQARPAPQQSAVPGSSTRNGGSYLGIEPLDINAERAGQLGLKENHGVEVGALDQDGPAAKAGMKEHDVILTFSGHTVRNSDQLRYLLRKTLPGSTVGLGISRSGQAMNLSATLTSRKQMMAMLSANRSVQIPEIHIPAMEFEFPEFGVVQYWGQNGVMLEDLTPQLAEFFGVPDGQGVLVRSVEKGSPADAAGLKAGDVIVKINGEPVGCAADWRNYVHKLQAGTMNLGIVRDRREQTVSVKIPERKTSGLFPSDFDSELADMRKQLSRMDLQDAMAGVQSEVNQGLEQGWREMQRELESAQTEFEHYRTW